MTAGERFLVTGALGCIGAWTVRTLAMEGTPVVAFDLAANPQRLRLIMSPEALRAVTFVTGDITDLESIERALDEHEITNVIHLAALQVPDCKANPPLGARVNVVGTANMFEAVSQRPERIRQLVYTGSVGMFSASDADPMTGVLRADATPHPLNHYGVYKAANEGTARVYWLDRGLSSIGLRPMTVYGPGRDRGLTSTPTKAILAAILGRRYEITFGGRTLFQSAADVASALIIASRATLPGAHAFNLGGTVAHIREVIDAIEAAVPDGSGLLTHAEAGLPFPEEIDTTGLDLLGPVPVTSLADGIGATADLFREKIHQGWMATDDYALIERTVGA